MAEPLKNLYNETFFGELNNINAHVIRGFNEKLFMRTVLDVEWQNCALKQRMRKITLAYHKVLPTDFEVSAEIIVHIVKEFLRRKGEGLHFLPMFLPEYIELFGIHNLTVSVRAFEEITKFTSCEFAVRPFIVKYEQKMMQQMLRWSMHENQYVRRLSSEGCRPRLPWAMALPAFKKDPSPILPILENLKSDNSLTVRKSVANNLNDISKDHPAVVLQILKQWKGFSWQTDWMIKHAGRTLLKKGDVTTLKIFALDAKHKATVERLKLSKTKIQIGETLYFTFQFKNKEKKAHKFRIEYAVYYVKANKTLTKKVFQVAESVFLPDKMKMYTKQQQFKDLTTRKHYPGEHILCILVNGKEHARQKFILTK
jgi:3-methyladenine DNA glycosylase AlkC